MNRYSDEINQLNMVSNELHDLVLRLTVNIKTDREGTFTPRTQFSERLYELLDSLQYRLSSVRWHLDNLCYQHLSYENQLKKNPKNITSYNGHTFLYFLFDDFIFNLISLYDYLGCFINLAFINENKPGLMWGRMAHAARNPNNWFSYCDLGKKISQHNKKWVQKLENFRAEIIHCNTKIGSRKNCLSWSVGESIQHQLICTIPEDIVEMLELGNCKRNKAGVDLQFGAIEIGFRSIKALKEISEIALLNCTQNSLNFIKTNKK